MMRTRIKFCGMTNAEDALLAANLGVDAVGMVFYAPSPRNVSISQAQAICRILPPFITTVGVFVNADEAVIRDILQQVPLAMLQFHGHETAAQCDIYRKPYIKAINMRTGVDVAQTMAQYPHASGFLLDSYQIQRPGGTGTVFDWDSLPKALNRPIILAGGLNTANLEEAILKIRPYAVDVVSGIEATQGRKDPDKMAAFIRQVQIHSL